MKKVHAENIIKRWKIREENVLEGNRNIYSGVFLG